MVACACSMISCSAQLEFDDHTTRTPEIDPRDKPGDYHVKTVTMARTPLSCPRNRVLRQVHRRHRPRRGHFEGLRGCRTRAA